MSPGLDLGAAPARIGFVRTVSHLLVAVLVALAAFLLPACTLGGDGTEMFTEDEISIRYPESWHVTPFSTTNSPRRLAVASYPSPEETVEGDCGGLQAVRRLPREGALVLLIDYGQRGSFAPRPDVLTLGDGEFAEYECFGPSTMFR